MDFHALKNGEADVSVNIGMALSLVVGYMFIQFLVSISLMLLVLFSYGFSAAERITALISSGKFVFMTGGIGNLLGLALVYLCVKMGAKGKNDFLSVVGLRQRPGRFWLVMAIAGPLLLILLFEMGRIFLSTLPMPNAFLVFFNAPIDFYVFIGFFPLAAVVEEIIHRGIVYPAFAKRFGTWPGVAASTAIFGMTYVISYWGDWAWIIRVFLLGAIYAMLRAKSGSTWPGMIAFAVMEVYLFFSALYGLPGANLKTLEWHNIASSMIWIVVIILGGVLFAPLLFPGMLRFRFISGPDSPRSILQNQKCQPLLRELNEMGFRPVGMYSEDMFFGYSKKSLCLVSAQKNTFASVHPALGRVLYCFYTCFNGQALILTANDDFPTITSKNCQVQACPQYGIKDLFNVHQWHLDRFAAQGWMPDDASTPDDFLECLQKFYHHPAVLRYMRLNMIVASLAFILFAGFFSNWLGAVVNMQRESPLPPVAIIATATPRATLSATLGLPPTWTPLPTPAITPFRSVATATPLPTRTSTPSQQPSSTSISWPLILSGHAERVNSVAYRLDGKQIASASKDSTIKLWDAATGALLRTLTGHTGSVADVAFNPSGELLASAGSTGDNTIRLWAPASGELLRTLTGHTDIIYAVEFSPDGELLASAGKDTQIILWDAHTGNVFRLISGQHRLAVRGLAFSPDGRTLATCSLDGTVKIWNVLSGELLATLSDEDAPLLTVAYHPTEKWIAAGGADGKIRLWDVSSGKLLALLTANSNGVNGLSFDPTGKFMASAGSDTKVMVFNLAAQQISMMLPGHTGWVLDVAFSPDGKYLVSAGGDDDHSVRIWKLEP